MGKKKAEGSGAVASSAGGKLSDQSYKREMRWERNKKLRAARHAKRMEAQTRRVLDRWERGAPLPPRTIKRLKEHVHYRGRGVTAMEQARFGADL